MSVFNSWKNARGGEGELLTMSNESLNLALKFFILEVRNKSGKEYYPNTIYELIISLQHYLRANKRFVSFLDDTEFNTMREVLDAKMKSLSKQGIGLTRRQADIIKYFDRSRKYHVAERNARNRLTEASFGHFTVQYEK